jgi:uncharacterized protein (TIGR03083 family)
MTGLTRSEAQDALAAGYGSLTAVVGQLSETDMMLPSRCAGWAVSDVLYHQLLDARRALRAFASPSPDPADVDSISYWRPYAPGSGQPAAPGGAGAARHARHVRIAASAYSADELAWEWRETSQAALRAARACGYETLATQGHSLRTADFIATLAFESAIHYLDLTVGLPSAPEPDPVVLALVRRVLDGLLGAPMPAGWDDRTYALKGTGRLPVSAAERSAIGQLAERVPLLG